MEGKGNVLELGKDMSSLISSVRQDEELKKVYVILKLTIESITGEKYYPKCSRHCYKLNIDRASTLSTVLGAYRGLLELEQKHK